MQWLFTFAEWGPQIQPKWRVTRVPSFGPTSHQLKRQPYSLTASTTASTASSTSSSSCRQVNTFSTLPSRSCLNLSEACVPSILNSESMSLNEVSSGCSTLGFPSVGDHKLFTSSPSSSRTPLTVIFNTATSTSPSHVSLISGGGSGHEPSHAGFVGSGLLDASICGNVFASPNVKQIRRGIDLVNGEKGTLIVVM